jgi:hypothetical protein
MRGFVAGAVLTAALIGAAPAAAQDYGGGRLPFSTPIRPYTPTVGITLQVRGDRMAFRFDTSVQCPGYRYEILARRSVPFDGRRFAAKGNGRFRIGTHRGNRVTYRWRLRGQADGTIASGRLFVTGTRYIDGRRESCRSKPRRRFSARVAGPAPAGSPVPPAKAAFGGLSDVDVGGGLRGHVLLKVGGSAKRIGSRWTVFATCGRGPRDKLTNITPPMRLRPDGSFSRAERFTAFFVGLQIRYRVRFAGRVSGEFANGTLRMRSRIYTRNGRRLLTRCDSGTRNWTAAMLRPIAPAG